MAGGETMNDVDAALLIARVFLAAVFLYSGLDKLRYWREGVAEMKDVGLPMPTLSLIVVIAIQLGAGLMVLLGIHARIGAWMLLAFTGAATLIGHRFWTLSGIASRRSFTTALEHLAMMGGFLLLALTGPGRYALIGP